MWQTALGLGVSAVFLYLALRGVSLTAIGREIAGARYGWFLASIVLATLTFPARAARWRIILAQSAGSAGYSAAWRATAIGFMANNILPARAGEVVRAYAASRLVPLPLSTAIGSIAVERIFDGLIVVLLLAIAIAAPAFPADASVGGTSLSSVATWTGALFVAILAALFAVVHAPAGALAVAGDVVRKLLPPRAAGFTVGLARNFIEGLSILRAPRDFARVVLWSFAVWLINAAAFYAGFVAFRLEGLPFTSALLLQGITAIGVAIPSSPGFFGLFEYASRAGLGLYGVPAASSVSFAVGIHLGWFVPITVIGLWTLARANLSLADLRGRGEQTP